MRKRSCEVLVSVFFVYAILCRGIGLRARVEILPSEMPRMDEVGESLLTDLHGAGYDEVVMDPQGYRSPFAYRQIHITVTSSSCDCNNRSLAFAAFGNIRTADNHGIACA